MAIVRRLLGLAVLACASACNRVGAVKAPTASFLVAAGDSTFWVTLDARGPVVRRSAILLAQYGGRFYEVYVVDDDRSF